MMRLVLIGLLILMVSLVSVSAELGTTSMNFTAIDDARVSSDEPFNTFGNKQLRVGVDGTDISRTYIKFDIGVIPNSSNILEGKLTLSKHGGEGESDVDTFRVLVNSWDEDTINWNTAPIAFDQLLSTTSLNSSQGLREIDVVDGISPSLTSGLFSLIVKNKDESPGSRYHIFQNKDQSVLGPNLEVEFMSNVPEINSVNVPLTADEGDLIEISFDSFDLDDNVILEQIYFDDELLGNLSTLNYQVNYEDSGSKEIKLVVVDETGLSREEIHQIDISDVSNLKINEFMPIPSAGTEWVEFYNPTNSLINVDNCEIRDGFGNILGLQGSIGALSLEVVDNLGRNLIIGNSLLNDDGDMIRLFCDGILVDEATFGIWDDGNFNDNIDVPLSGESIGRKNDGLDTDVDDIDFVIYNPDSKGLPNTGQVCDEEDTDCSGCVSQVEITTYASKWLNGDQSITQVEVTSAASRWLNGISSC